MSKRQVECCKKTSECPGSAVEVRSATWVSSLHLNQSNQRILNSQSECIKLSHIIGCIYPIRNFHYKKVKDIQEGLLWSRNRAVQYMYVTISFQFQCEMYDICSPISKYIPNIRHFNTPFVENVLMKLKTIRCNLHDTFTFSIVIPTKWLDGVWDGNCWDRSQHI